MVRIHPGPQTHESSSWLSREWIPLAQRNNVKYAAPGIDHSGDFYFRKFRILALWYAGKPLGLGRNVQPTNVPAFSFLSYESSEHDRSAMIRSEDFPVVNAKSICPGFFSYLILWISQYTFILVKQNFVGAF